MIMTENEVGSQFSMSTSSVLELKVSTDSIKTTIFLPQSSVFLSVALTEPYFSYNEQIL